MPQGAYLKGIPSSRARDPLPHYVVTDRELFRFSVEKIIMRIKRVPNFRKEVIYRESPDKKDRIRQLWDLLISLPEPETIPPVSQTNNKNHYENQKSGTKNI